MYLTKKSVNMQREITCHRSKQYFFQELFLQGCKPNDRFLVALPVNADHAPGAQDPD